MVLIDHNIFLDHSGSENILNKIRTIVLNSNNENEKWKKQKNSKINCIYTQTVLQIIVLFAEMYIVL